MELNDFECQLIFLSITGNVQEAKKILPLISSVNFEDNNRNSPLNMAVANKQYDMLAFLIQNGGNLHYIDKANTCLWHMVKDLTMFNTLIDYGMDVHLMENDEDSPLNHFKSQHTDIAKKMIDFGVSYKHLQWEHFPADLLKHIEDYEMKQKIYEEKEALEQHFNSHTSNQTHKIKL
jgi:ankyrin repeat protein